MVLTVTINFRSKFARLIRTNKDKPSIRTFIKDILKKKGQIRTIRTIRT